ncbi:hypothetical protein L227DRAFT_501092 [Lentinus tigrinus ALCF2SS1-6]|uniref:VHS domain-containing protein n=1 Tax=Lentinus tigrinus ALCF2SS1-6 TaxID=1328759 RepID=A0A5C2SAK9_9APHY|nr:hypothetical protein L227DRAFT_501092 [Lentinus tigrinus ALCF2SS1-6]
MKKLFGRDKPKPVKVTPGGRDDNHAYSSHRHDRLQTGSDDQWDLIQETEPPLQPLRPPTLPASQTSSLASINQTGSPVPSPLPRSTSPFSTNSNSPAPNQKSAKERDQQVLRKKPPATPNGFAAVGILNSLNPAHLEPVSSHEQSDDGFTELSHREEKEKKEKRPFWDRAVHNHKDKEKEREKERTKERDRERDRDRDRERDKEREHDRKDEGPPAELTRLLGYLFATASEDWSLVLEVCDRVSASETSAKEAAKALRQEFKGGEPSTQLAAARLWAIMLRNCSLAFVKQCASRKFLDSLEDVLKAKTTPPVVRERLIAVLAAASYASDSDSGFRHLWRKVKKDDQPDEGIPFDTDDAMFYPATPRHSVGPNAFQPPHVETLRPQSTTPEPQQPQHRHTHHSHHPPERTGTPQRPPPTVTSGKTKSSSRNRVIPPEEDIRRLFQECKVGRGNAGLLSEALTYAKPEDLKNKDIIKEFYARCRASQELISAQIPWAFAQAERSREAAGKTTDKHKEREGRHSVDREREREQLPPSPKKDKDSERLTTEEKLLAAILASNEELLEALRLYDDLERVGIERDAEERSKREIRMDRSKLRYDEESGMYLDPGQPTHGGASSSRSPSPAPSSSPSLAPSLVVTPSQTHSNISQPVPARPAQTNHVNQVDRNHHQPGHHGSAQSLAPPPPAPHGPRLPVHRSNTPSPERGSLHSVARTSTESTQVAPMHTGSRLRQDSSEEWTDAVADADDDVKTPVRPSAKALGKRKVVEPSEGDRECPFDPDDMFYEHSNDSIRNSEDSDSDDARARNPWHRPVHYVYDAAAERTQQRIREGRLAAAALVGGVH